MSKPLFTRRKRGNTSGLLLRLRIADCRQTARCANAHEHKSVSRLGLVFANIKPLEFGFRVSLDNSKPPRTIRIKVDRCIQVKGEHISLHLS